MWQILDMRVVQFNVFRSIKQRLSKWHQYINTSGRRRQSWGQSRSWENNHPPALHYWTNSSTLHGWTLAAIALNFLDPDLFFLSLSSCVLLLNIFAQYGWWLMLLWAEIFGIHAPRGIHRGVWHCSHCGCAGHGSAPWALGSMGVTVPPCRHSLAQGIAEAEVSTSPHPFSAPGNKERTVYVLPRDVDYPPVWIHKGHRVVKRLFLHTFNKLKKTTTTYFFMTSAVLSRSDSI